MSIIIGGNGADSISGTSSSDVIASGNGNDVIDAGAGNDVVLAGNGTDTVDGGAGADFIDGGNGNDILDGGSGSDLVLGGNGNDTLLYDITSNLNACDLYVGGNGCDTLVLKLDLSKYNASMFDLAALISAINAYNLYHTNVFSFADDFFNLTIASVEKIVLQTYNSPPVAPVAVNDTASGDEDAILPITGNVLTNDTAAAGAVVSLVSGPASGVLALQADGTYTFTPLLNFNGDISFTYKITAGGLDSNVATVTIHVAAVNDAAVITGDINKSLDEDTANVAGALLAADVDNTPNLFQAEVLSGDYGDLTMNTDGTWSYARNAVDVQSLNVGDELYDEFSVKSDDGTEQLIKVTITGLNDAAVISAPVVNLTETDAVLSTGGTLSITDIDNPATFVAQNNIVANYGTFNLASNGDWTYVTSSAHNEFVAGTTYTDTLNVTSADGTPSVITVNIAGTNEIVVNPAMIISALTPVTASAAFGDVVTYSFTFTNIGLGNATNFTLTNLMPTGMTYFNQSMIYNGVILSDGPGGEIAPGVDATFDFSATNTIAFSKNLIEAGTSFNFSYQATVSVYGNQVIGNQGGYTYYNGQSMVNGVSNLSIITTNTASPLSLSGGDTASFNVNENMTDIHTIVASGGSGAITYEIDTVNNAANQDAALFQINSLTGALSFIQAQDYELPSDVGADRVYNVIIKAIAGAESDTQALTINLKDVNGAPIIASNGGGDVAISIIEGQTGVSGKILSTDPDGDAITYAISATNDPENADRLLFGIDESTSSVYFISAPVYVDGGDNIYNVMIEAQDDRGGVDTQAFVVTVNPTPTDTSGGGGGGVPVSGDDFVVDPGALLPPIVTSFAISDAELTLAGGEVESALVTIAFDKNVTGVDLGDFILGHAHGDLSHFEAQSARVYTATFIPTAGIDNADNYIDFSMVLGSFTITGTSDHFSIDLIA